MVFGAAVNDAVSYRDRLKALRVTQPGSGGSQSGGDVRHLLWSVGLLDQGFSISIRSAQFRPRPDTFHLPLDQPLGGVTFNGKHLKLHTRRAGIDDQERVHAYTAGKGAFRRRAST